MAVGLGNGDSTVGLFLVDAAAAAVGPRGGAAEGEEGWACAAARCRGARGGAQRFAVDQLYVLICFHLFDEQSLKIDEMVGPVVILMVSFGQKLRFICISD